MRRFGQLWLVLITTTILTVIGVPAGPALLYLSGRSRS
jgi:hypothetical protein